jgi:hypothetical protein
MGTPTRDSMPDPRHLEWPNLTIATATAPTTDYRDPMMSDAELSLLTQLRERDIASRRRGHQWVAHQVDTYFRRYD